MKKIIQPKVFQTEAWKRIEAELSKPPQVLVKARNSRSKKERENAKLIEQFINYAFEHNTDGITNKYMQVMKLARDKFFKEQVDGFLIQAEWMEKAVDQIVKQEKKVVDE